MSSPTSPPPLSQSSSSSTVASSLSSWTSSGSEMYGTERTHKSATRSVYKQHTHQHSEVNKDSWAAEISEKISLVNEPLETFFSGYVPCHRNFNGERPWTDPAEVFAKVPISGREKNKYRHLISGLRKLVSNFDDVRRPKFADGSKCVVPFPFKDWEEEHHYTLPDILMSFPGENEQDDTWAETWHRIAMVFEVKNAADPINETAPWPSVRPGVTATSVLTQLAKSARNLILTHGMLFAFVIGIYKDSARIYRFDRAACVVSRSFKIKTTPWPLHELLWRMCHYEAPVGGLSTRPLVPRLLGEDPTLFRASDQDRDLADEKCKEIGQRPLSKEERDACRWVTIAKYDNDGKFAGSNRILLYRVRSLNPRLFSRATLVSEGFEEGTWKRLAVKDAWRQIARDREDAFYDQIRDSMHDRSWRDVLEDYKFLHRNDMEHRVPPFAFGPYKLSSDGPCELPQDLEEILVEAELDPMVGELFGLARMQYGDDLGAREVARVVRLDDGNHPRPAQYEFFHRTICRGPRGAANSRIDCEYNERSHMRLVFETVGRPLSQFKSTKEMVKGFRDAIHGHRQAYLAGVIHRDISESNVMLSDDLMAFFIGFLLDLDYGFNWKDMLRKAGWEVSEASWERYVKEYDRSLPSRTRPAPPEVEVPLMGPATGGLSNEAKDAQEAWKARMKFKERTGTLYFMAIEILATHVAHDVRHDLESFFWLLLWVVLRYTCNTSWPKYTLYGSVFGQQTERDSVAHKRLFLEDDMNWEIKGNKPLTTLVSRFKGLVEFQNPSKHGPTAQPLTYEKVLALFDEAVASPDWPQNDRALVFKMPSKPMPSATPEGSQLASGSRGGEKRDAPDEPDPLSIPVRKRAHVHRPLTDDSSDAEDSDDNLVVAK